MNKIKLIIKINKEESKTLKQLVKFGKAKKIVNNGNIYTLETQETFLPIINTIPGITVERNSKGRLVELI